MGTMATVRVNTTQRKLLYRDFVIEESTEGWEWTHDDYARPGTVGYRVTGQCQTAYECIDAVYDWYDNTEATS